MSARLLPIRRPGRAALAGAATVAAAMVLGAVSAQDPAPGREPPAPAPGSDLFAQPGQCGQCHVEEGWDRLKAPAPGAFDHATTGFPLRGAHADVTCDDCHRRGLEGLTSSCEACHHDPHAGLNSKACERCHTERSWEVPRNLTIHEATRFPLTGAHAVVQCEACHRPRRGEPLATTPLACGECHARDFRRARPNHVAAGFATCGLCHSTSTFRGAVYVHRAYVLTGKHVTTRCVQCHTGTTFAGLASGGTSCVTCHLSDYNRTSTIGGTTPDHVANNFSQTCSACHNTGAFRPANP